MKNACRYCSKDLVKSEYFCDIVCENNYQDNNRELHIKYNDATYDWICPVVEFEETEDELICHNGYYEYKFDKSEVEKWKIDKCSCLQEFTSIDAKF